MEIDAITPKSSQKTELFWIMLCKNGSKYPDELHLSKVKVKWINALNCILNCGKNVLFLSTRWYKE
jgi:hypothetical protein